MPPIVTTIITRFKIVLPFDLLYQVSNNRDDTKMNNIALHLSNIIISTPTTGVNYLMYGRKNSSDAQVSTDGLIAMSPAMSYDYSGRSVDNAGDINGDGYDDLIIGVPYAARCYVLFGTAQGFVNMTDGFTIFGAQSSDLTGWSVSGAGDVNNDTFADIIIGAPLTSHSSLDSTGTVYVLYGHSSNFTNIFLSEVKPQQGFVLFGTTFQQYTGISVSSAGDVNNDGYDDIIVGALSAVSFYAGAAYVVYGSQQNPITIILNSMSNTQGFAIQGLAWSYFGYSVSGAGDVNGDGYDDMLIGSVPNKGAAYGTQNSYLIYGNSSNIGMSVIGMTAQQGMVISGGGVVVSGVGDINHDGYDEILIGNNYGFSGAGFVVTYPAFDTWRPTTTPTITPTITSSAIPSVPPTTQPSNPTYLPTVHPSAPTYLPTPEPTTPTAEPSFSPTIIPTLAPTHRPTRPRSVKPTTRQPQTVTPSAQHPTITTDMPTLEPTNTENPSQQPNTLKPTRNPHIRTTLRPTIFQPASRNSTVWITSANEIYYRDSSNIHFIVNHTALATVVGTVGINIIFTIIPNRNAHLDVNYFNSTSDLIDLKAFTNILKFTDIKITTTTTTAAASIVASNNNTAHNTRQLTANNTQIIPIATQSTQSEVTTTIITLPHNQIIIIHNTTSAIASQNFILYSPQTTIPSNKNNNILASQVVAGVIIGSVCLFLCYKTCTIVYTKYKQKHIKMEPIQWDEIRKNNPTFLSFFHQDSWVSVASQQTNHSYSTNKTYKTNKSNKSRVSSQSNQSKRTNKSNFSQESKSIDDFFIDTNTSSSNNNSNCISNNSNRNNNSNDSTLNNDFDELYSEQQSDNDSHVSENSDFSDENVDFNNEKERNKATFATVSELNIYQIQLQYQQQSAFHKAGDINTTNNDSINNNDISDSDSDSGSSNSGDDLNSVRSSASNETTDHNNHSHRHHHTIIDENITHHLRSQTDNNSSDVNSDISSRASWLSCD